MNNNLGPDEAWNDAVWQDIDKAVLEEVGRIRVAQKVFPSTSMPNAANVLADIFYPRTMSIAEGQTKQFVEIIVEFPLFQSQVDDQAKGTQKTGTTLARMAAKTVTLAEDMLLFQGQEAELPHGVTVFNRDSAVIALLGRRRHSGRSQLLRG